MSDDYVSKSNTKDYMKIYHIFTAIILCLILFVIIYLIYLTFNPNMPIKYIKTMFHIQGDADIETDSSDIKLFTFEEFTGKIYYYIKNESNYETIILDLPGGAFLHSSNTFKHYQHMPDLNLNVISIQYPVLPEGVAVKALSYIENAINFIISEHSDLKNIYLNTASAGSYYGVKLINNGKFSQYIKKFSATSGYFGYKTVDHILAILCDKFYLRRLARNTTLDCSPPSSTIETFYAIAEIDPLAISTKTFLSETNQTNEILIYSASGHCFYLHFNSLDTQKYYQDFMEFIKN